MEFYTVEQWQENWDQLLARVENGESIGIYDGNNRAIMVPYQEYHEVNEQIKSSLSNLENAVNS